MKTLEQLLVEKPVEKVGLFYYPEREFFCMIDREKYNSTDITREFFDKVYALYREKKYTEIRDLFIAQGGNKDLIRLAAIRILVAVGDVRVKGNSLYMDPIPHPLPVSLVDEMLEIVQRSWDRDTVYNEEDYLILRNFWVWVKNIWDQRQDKESVFTDKFIQSLLQDYKKTQHFFRDVLKDKKTTVIVNPIEQTPEKENKPNIDLSGRTQQL